MVEEDDRGPVVTCKDCVFHAQNPDYAIEFCEALGSFIKKDGHCEGRFYKKRNPKLSKIDDLVEALKEIR